MKSRAVKLVLIISISSFLFGIILYNYINYIDDKFRINHIKESSHFAKGIDLEKLKKLSGDKSDLEKDEYKELKKQFELAIRVNSRYKYIYILGKNKQNKLFFFIDTGQPENRKDEAYPGKPYTDAPKGLIDIFNNKKQTAVGPYKDQWGNFVTSITPLFDKESNFLGLLGIDISHKDWGKRIFLTILPFALILIILFIFIIILLIVVLKLNLSLKKLKIADRALKENEEKLNTLFTSMSEMVVMHELVFDDLGNAVNYRIVDCNKAFTIITGITKEAAIGKLADEVYKTPNPPYLKEFSTVALTKNSYQYQTYFSPMDKHFSISAVYLGKNKFATVTSDITPIIQVQEIITAKNKELENYLYVASHDLRTPLVNIQGFSQFLKEETDKINQIINESDIEQTIKDQISEIVKGEIAKDIEFISINISKMDYLIKGLLQVSRTGRQLMNITEADMNKLMNDIVNSHSFQISEIKAVIDIDDLSNCYGDINLLNSIFSNLISNALKYRSKDRYLKIKIKSKVKYNKVIYSVEDNGIGISKKNLEKIWNIFFRVNSFEKDSGDGLGLSIVRRIVERHKGKARAVSELDKGTTFFIELQNKPFEEIIALK